MSSERLQPLYLDASALPGLPDKWTWAKFEDAAVAVPVGRKYDSKSVVTGGVVPVIDQSTSGVIGHHSDEPGVKASGACPVFTFANHTCAMRWMPHSFSCIQNVFVFKGSDGCDARYLYYASQGRVVLEEYKGHAPVFRSMFVPVPPPMEQRDIGALLASLDDRITLLRETNATLRAIAQALFKSWFVDFDPVRAKMEGRVPEGMDEATAALFPDSFEETELGDVPRGWALRSFIETVDVLGGGTPQTSMPEYWGGDIPWFSVVDAPDGADTFAFNTEKCITEAGLAGSSAKLLPKGTTIISARGTVGKLAITGHTMAMNQSCYGLSGKAGDVYFTYFATCRLVAALKARSHGSVFDTITRATLASVRSLYPQTPHVIEAFEVAVTPFMERILSSVQQSQALAILRDAVLPRLISGQLRVPEAQPLIDEAIA